MATVPTNQMERELRKLYLRWLGGLDRQTDVASYITQFQGDSTKLIARLGGQAASLGALAGFPVPKTLELSPFVGKVYDSMQQAAISASITAGLNSKDAARQMLNAGLGKSYRRLERLARTETVSAYWKNQWDSTADLPLLVMVWGSEESKRTCDYCLSRDGLVVEDSSIRDHPNGRCTLIPTLRSRVNYKGTLQPDGSIDMDPRWADQKVKGAKAMQSAGPTTAAQRDPLSGKGNPAAPSKAQPVHTSQAGTGPVSEVSAKALFSKQPASVAPTSPRIIKSVSDMEDFGAKMPVPSTLTTKAAQTVDDYAKGTAYTANAVLRGQKTYMGRAIDARTKTYTKKFTKEMDSMMDASIIPEDVRVVRALGADAFGGVDELQKLAGGIYQDKGYMSTSLAEKTSSAVYDVKDSVAMEITVPKGSRGIYMAGESYLKSERELLLDRGTRLAVQSVTYDKKVKQWKVKAMVIPSPR